MTEKIASTNQMEKERIMLKKCRLDRGLSTLQNGLYPSSVEAGFNRFRASTLAKNRTGFVYSRALIN